MVRCKRTFSSEEPPMRDRPCLTSADVEKAVSACKAEAQKHKWNVSIAVLDEGGFLLEFHRMEGAPAISAQVAGAPSMRWNSSRKPPSSSTRSQTHPPALQSPAPP